MERCGSSVLTGCSVAGRAGQSGDEPVVVHDRVVALAQQCRVVEVDRAAVGPVDDVVRVAPAGRGGAAWEVAVAISQPEGSGLRLGEQAHRRAQVE